MVARAGRVFSCIHIRQKDTGIFHIPQLSIEFCSLHVWKRKRDHPRFAAFNCWIIKAIQQISDVPRFSLRNSHWPSLLSLYPRIFHGGFGDDDRRGGGDDDHDDDDGAAGDAPANAEAAADSLVAIVYVALHHVATI